MPLNVNEIHQGDATELLPRVQPNSVALSIWSPPYFVGKEYESHLSYEGWKSLITSVIRLHEPILIPGGFLVVNIADILAFKDPRLPRIQAMTLSRQRVAPTRDDILKAKEAHPDYNRDKLAALLGCSEQTIDRRLNGNNIRGGKYATQTRVHLVGNLVEDAGESVGLHLYDRRAWVKDPAWESSKWHALSYRAVDEFEYLYIFWKPGATVVDRARLSSREWVDWGSRAVWNIPSVRANDDHEAKFPVELVRRCIKLLSAPGSTILDCFMGSGTTAVAAIREGRHFIGIERHPSYVQLSRRAVQRELMALPLLGGGPEVLDSEEQLELMEST